MTIVPAHLRKPSKIKPDKLTKVLQDRGGRDYTRELARQRDGRKCQMCGKQWIEGQRRFDVHHIIGCGYMSQEYDKVATIENLITYCHKCHLNLHSVKRKMSERDGQNKLNKKHQSAYYKKK